MFDYRLFFASTTLDTSTERERHPLLGHDPKRVYRLAAERAAERREQRSRGRR